MSELGKVCAHEQLERQCPICERDIEISRLKDMELFYKAELEHAKEALAEREHESEIWKWQSHFWRRESDEKDRKIASLESKLAKAREALQLLKDMALKDLPTDRLVDKFAVILLEASKALKDIA